MTTENIEKILEEGIAIALQFYNEGAEVRQDKIYRCNLAACKYCDNQVRPSTINHINHKLSCVVLTAAALRRYRYKKVKKLCHVAP